MMDELQVLREFRSDIAPHAELDAARGRLLAAIDAAEPSGNGAEAVIRGRGAPRRRAGRRAVALIAAAASAGALALAIALPADHGGPTTATAALREAAVVAGEQPVSGPPAAGQYQYGKLVYREGLSISAGFQGVTGFHLGLSDPFEGAPLHVLGPERTGQHGIMLPASTTTQVWIAGDSSGRVVAAPHFEHPPGELANGQDLDTAARDDQRFGPPSEHPKFQYVPEFRDLSGLPDDPGALRKLIEEGRVENPANDDSAPSQESTPVQTFEVARDLLGTPTIYAPPRIRQALYEVIAGLPGVQLLGDVEDGAGRSGAAVAMTNHGVRRVLIFDPQSSALLAQKDVIVDPEAVGVDVEPGTLLNSTTYLLQGVVDSVTETPQPAETPAAGDSAAG